MPEIQKLLEEILAVLKQLLARVPPPAPSPPPEPPPQPSPPPPPTPTSDWKLTPIEWVGIKHLSRVPLPAHHDPAYLGFRDNFSATPHSVAPFCPSGAARCEVHAYRDTPHGREFASVKPDGEGGWDLWSPYGTPEDQAVKFGPAPADISVVLSRGADFYQSLPGKFIDDPVDKSSTNPWNAHIKPRKDEQGTYTITACPGGERVGSGRCRSITHQVP